MKFKNVIKETVNVEYGKNINGGADFMNNLRISANGKIKFSGAGLKNKYPFLYNVIYKLIATIHKGKVAKLKTVNIDKDITPADFEIDRDNILISSDTIDPKFGSRRVARYRIDQLNFSGKQIKELRKEIAKLEE